jgi:hypothetical protein
MARRFEEVQIRPRDWLIPLETNLYRDMALERNVAVRMVPLLAVAAIRNLGVARDLAQLAQWRFGDAFDLDRLPFRPNG